MGRFAAKPVALLASALLAVVLLTHWQSGGGQRWVVAGPGPGVDAPLVHGALSKKALLPYETWRHWADTSTFDEYTAGRTGGTKDFPPRGLPCQVYINTEYKFLYVRLPKTGSTTITTSFRECATNTTGQRGCLRWLHKAQPDLTAGELEKIWRTYFVFTFTRNVWTRAISQWQYLMHYMRNATDCPPYVTWDAFCRDPATLGDTCVSQPRCCSIRPMNMTSAAKQYLHLGDQLSCMAVGGEYAVDFVGRTDHLVEDLAAIRAKINARRPQGVRRLPEYKQLESRNAYGADCQPSQEDAEGGGGGGGGGPATGRRLASGYRHEPGMYWADLNYCNKADFYQGAHAACLKSISEWYRGDVNLLHGARGRG